MPMKKIIIVSVVAAALVLLGWFGREAVGFREAPKEERSSEPPAVAVISVMNAVFNPPVEYVGHVESAQVTDILPQIDGYIQRVCFTEVAKVTKGDLLFEIDPEQYLAAKNLRYSEVASAKAKVTVAQAEVERAERYYNRLMSADERGGQPFARHRLLRRLCRLRAPGQVSVRSRQRPSGEKRLMPVGDPKATIGCPKRHHCRKSFLPQMSRCIWYNGARHEQHASAIRERDGVR